ncbi:S8 family serine peptidase [Chloroflexia bacterium SDU3-3]|nr:S8 family serine peptidase [Chloroflexia bacterium SDU3-3]
MRHLFRSLATVVILASMVPLTASAQHTQPPTVRDSQKLAGAELAAKIPPSLQQAKGDVQVLLELKTPPTFQVAIEGKSRGFSQNAIAAAQRSQLATIKGEQSALQSALTSAGAKTIYTSQRVYNGVAVMVDAAKLSTLSSLSSVKAIHRLTPKQLDNSISVPEIGAPQLWNTTGANVTGTGIRVGIIDTGIDYTHANFGGTKDYAANDGAVIEPGSFPTAKVAGGTDLAGDDYNADPTSPSYQPVPHPDADPLDCSADDGGGHGSHVAGTVAGLGVTTAGNTYAGPYNSSLDFSLSSFKIGPGVAPGALLYGIRVFGCDGSTNLVVPALDYAIDPNGDGDTSDHLDVVNMSLGSGYSGYDDLDTDPDAVASERAVSAGVVVVASSGNAYDTHYITGSPGSAASVISVASSVDAADIMDSMHVTADSEALADTLQPISFSAAYAWDSAPGFTGDIVYPPTQRDGCAAFTTANKALLNGKIALLDWTDPSCGGSVARTGNAVAAGAKGVILVDNTDVFDLSITGSSVAPSASMPKATGAAIKAALAAGKRVTATFDKAYRGTGQYGFPGQSDTLSDFSSMGPRRDGLLKPDIAAPGQGIFSTRSGSNTGGESLNGTSMAAPQIAGSLALLRQLHPGWSVQELKALAMNTAKNDVRSAVASNSPIFGPTRMGAGRVDLVNAANDSVLIYNKEQPNVVGVSFGTLEITEAITLQKQATVENKGASSVTYDLSYVAAASIPGVAYTVSPAQVTVAAGASVDVTITLTVDPAQLNHALSPSENSTQVGYARNWISEAQGYLKLVPTTAASELRLPVYAAPRITSTMQASDSEVELTGAASQDVSIDLTGEGFDTGLAADDTFSLVSAFELAYTSPDAGSTGVARASDIQHVGVSSTYAPDLSIDDTKLYFLVSGYGSWDSPNIVDYEIFIDSDNDGFYDYVLYNNSIKQNTSPTDVFVTSLYDYSVGASSAVGYLNFASGAIDQAPYHTNAMVLGADAADLGLTDSNSTFTYSVATYSKLTGNLVDSTPDLVYNPATPGVQFSGGIVEGIPLFVDYQGETIPAVYNRAAYADNDTQGIVLFHMHNAEGNKLEVIDLVEPTPTSTPTSTGTVTTTPTATATGTVTTTPTTPTATGTVTTTPTTPTATGTVTTTPTTPTATGTVTTTPTTPTATGTVTTTPTTPTATPVTPTPGGGPNSFIYLPLVTR